MNGRIPEYGGRFPACGWSEEAAAGFALGSLDPAMAQQYARHLRECPSCASLAGEWEALLDGQRRRSSAPQPAPSKRLKRRIMLSAALVALRRWLSGRTRPAIAFAAALMLLFGTTVIWRSGEALPGGEAREFAAAKPPVPPAAAIRDALHAPVAATLQGHLAEMFDAPLVEMIHVPAAEWFHPPAAGLSALLEPLRLGRAPDESASTDASPSPFANGTIGEGGYVLFNERGDLLLFLNGVEPRADLDYQAWSVRQDRRDHIGMLIQFDRLAYLYVQGADLRGWEAIAISLEPRGGSASPTGPDAITLRFK